MDTAELKQTESGQTICLPKGYEMPGTKVGLYRKGNSILIYPADKPWQDFFDSLDEFPADFMEGYNNQPTRDRENK